VNLDDTAERFEGMFHKKFDKGKFRTRVNNLIKEREESFYSDLIGNMSSETLTKLRDALDGKKAKR
jgi:hypothetical protein